MKTGDLVTMSDRSDMNNGYETGIVINIQHNVEYKPLIHVLWEGGHIFRLTKDDLEVVNEER